MDTLNEHITLFVLKNLEKLTDEEREVIRNVAERDEQLRVSHEGRLGVLKNEIETLQRARDARVDFSLTANACVLCMVGFGKFLNTGADCPACHRRVCKACRTSSPVHGRKWMCMLCDKEWELRNAAGEWMSRKDHVPRTSMAAFVLRSLLGLKKSMQLSVKQKAIADGHKLPATPAMDVPHSKRFRFHHKNSEERFIAAHSPMFNIVCSPKFRQSLHGPLRPLPAAKPKLTTPNHLHRPSLAEKITHSIHEAASLMQIHSESIFPHTPPNPMKTPRRTRSSPEVTAVNAILSKTYDVVDKQVEATPSDANEVDRVPFLFSSGAAEPIDRKLGVVTSTPRFFCGSDSDVSGLAVRAPKMDAISISTVGSGMEEQQVNIARETYGDIKLQVLFDSSAMCIAVTVLACRNLPSLCKKKIKFPSPYVKLYLYEPHCERIKRKTGTVKNSRNPTYAEVLPFPVVSVDSANGWLHVAVCTKKGFFRRTKILGETTLLVTPELLERRKAMWYPLNCTYIKMSGVSE